MPTLPRSVSGVDPRDDRVGAAAIGAVAIGGALVLARSVADVGLPCPMLAVTGVPCPACGLTRLAHALGHGRFAEAFAVDPAGVVLLGIVAAVAGLHVLGRRGLGPRAIPAGALAVAVAIAASLHWLTVLRGGMLPGA